MRAARSEPSRATCGCRSATARWPRPPMPWCRFPRSSATGFRGRGVTAVITDLRVLEPSPESRELTLTHVHPGVEADQVVAATGWGLRVADKVDVSAAPSEQELRALRALKTVDEVGVGG